jgi:hypothetical protein
MLLRSLYCLPLAIPFLAIGVPAFAIPPSSSGISVENTSATVISGNRNSVSNLPTQSVSRSTPNRTAQSGSTTVRAIQSCQIAGNGNTCVNQSVQRIDLRGR